MSASGEAIGKEVGRSSGFLIIIGALTVLFGIKAIFSGWTMVAIGSAARGAASGTQTA